MSNRSLWVAVSLGFAVVGCSTSATIHTATASSTSSAGGVTGAQSTSAATGASGASTSGSGTTGTAAGTGTTTGGTTGGAALDGGPTFTTLQSSVSDNGVTWTFSAPVPVGQFVTGEYFVVGDVTITGITPAPQTAAPYMNGSVKNLPTATGHSAFDQRLNDGVDESWFFDPTFRLYPPFSLSPGDALVSAVSLATPQTIPEAFGGTGAFNQSPIQSMSVLTVLSAAPVANAFRPSYCDRDQAIYSADALNRSLLPSLAQPTSAGGIPQISDYAPLFLRPWIDVTFFLWDVPGAYMGSYSQHFTFVEDYAALLLTLDFPADQKIDLTNGLVQRGIDIYGCAQAGVTWPAWGGYGHGRKLPVLLAGLLLNNAAMLNVSSTYWVFGEDMQTAYVSEIPGSYTQAWQGATVIYAGHEGVFPDGGTRDPTGFSGAAGPYEQLQPSAWIFWSGELIGEDYRRCCTSNVWIGEALAARLLGLQTAWNYPAFFDYADRWMREDDTQAIATILTETGQDFSADWERQGQTAAFLQGRVPEYTFVDDMWAAYR